MSSQHQATLHKWIRSITNKAPNDRNAPIIADQIMNRHFKTIYSTVDFCRELVGISIVAIVRKFLKEHPTDPDIPSDSWDALFQYYGINNLSEQVLLKKIHVQ